ncbi:hypothetical protein, partial [Chryseobacterium sp. CH1]
MGKTEMGIIKWLKRITLYGANTIYVAVKVLLVIPLFITIFEVELKGISRKITFKKALLFWSVSLLPLVFTSYILNSVARQFES